jgi:hypothetical protein
MTKATAKKRLKTAIKERNYIATKRVLDWGLDTLTKCEYYQFFVLDVARLPFKDAQWFRDNFPIFFKDNSGGRWVFC